MRQHLVRGMAVVLMIGGVTVPVLAAGSALADDYLNRPASGTFAVQGHGEGHGRGMSQYGAQGAAGAGLSSTDILNFYYPGTQATGVDPNTSIKVWISADDDNTTEVFNTPDLVVRDDGTGTAYPVPGNASRVRAVPSGSGFQVQVQVNGSWQDMPAAAPAAGAPAAGAAAVETPAAPAAQVDLAPAFLPADPASAALPAATGPLAADLEAGTPTPVAEQAPAAEVPQSEARVLVGGPVSFQSAAGYVTVQVGGNFRGYRGIVRAVRDGANSITVNQVGLDDYTRSVVPRESPSYWRPAALEAQAVAARSYGYVSLGAPRSSLYNICDTSACQNYGGASLNGASIEAASTNTATDATRGLIRTYNGGVINAQFGSTNGGWTVDGRVPYLPAQADPYEALGNPPQAYANWKGQLTAGSLESRYSSIGSFTRLRITQRDGNGDWGGRVVAAVVEGTRGSVTLTGDQLRLALDAPVRSTYFQVFDTAAANLPQGNIDLVQASGSALLIRGWTFDPDDPTTPLAVHVYDTAPNGSLRTSIVTANGTRNDVAAVYPGVGSSHGLDAVLTVSGSGTHQVCVYAINVGAGNGNRTLGCYGVAVGGVFGSVDSVSVGIGVATVSGWVIDANSAADSASVAVYDTSAAGTSGAAFPANQSRPDVAGAYPGSGAAHGFTATVPLTTGGSHNVCTYGVAVAGGANPLLYCAPLNVSAPIGNLDQVFLRNGAIVAGGWALDPARPGVSMEVHIYVSNSAGTFGYTGVVANGSRPDVAAVYPGVGSAHGYLQGVPVTGRGPTSVCAYVIASGPGAGNQTLGCGAVTI